LRKVLVTGASGLLGARLADFLSNTYEVVSTHRTQAIQGSSVRMDVTDRDAVLKVLSRFSPGVVVHAAAETNVDRCETNKDAAWKVNVDGTRNVAMGCARIGVKLVYVSTDYVFDGKKGLYVEDDRPNPVNYYGLTKLKAEESVEEICSDFVIARPSVLYGWHRKKLNFATWVIDSLRNGRGISVVKDHYNSPTLVDELAEVVLTILQRGLTGVYHTAGAEKVSRYEFAVNIADMFELDKSLITPVKMSELNVWQAKRPRDSSLCIDKLRGMAGVQPLPLDEALKILKNRMSRTKGQ